MFKKAKPAQRHPQFVFDDAIASAITEARRGGVDLRNIAQELEKQAETLRVQRACTAPLWQGP
jgi:hypothetical protein